MTAFQAWLAAAAERRRELGLVRATLITDATTPMLDLARNDYLGLRTDPRIIAGGLFPSHPAPEA